VQARPEVFAHCLSPGLHCLPPPVGSARTLGVTFHPLMTPLFKKLNLGAQPVIHVLNAPASFEPELVALKGVEVRRVLKGKVNFLLAFAVTQAEVDAASEKAAKAADGDATVWMAYPKGTSRKYKCEFNRDSGWSMLGAAGYEPVRQVAIDEDWSALRFRKVEYIKSITRDPAGAISKAGRARASGDA
jgi:hypothetical protein